VVSLSLKLKAAPVDALVFPGLPAVLLLSLLQEDKTVAADKVSTVRMNPKFLFPNII
jgi:hypothetical protein